MEEEVKTKILIERLHDIVIEGQKLLEGNSKERLYSVWALRTSFELSKIYGSDSEIYKEYRLFLNIIRRKEHFTIALFEEKFNKLISLYNYLISVNSSAQFINQSFPSKIPNTKNVFIIHGHDELNTRRLSDLLRDDFELNPIAIFLKPGMSRSIVEKFEDEARFCSFAFALFTKDDLIVKDEEKYYQARPNVIFESGWFLGRLGISRIILLLQNGTNLHSDLHGILRIQFEKNITEKYPEIKSELKAAKLV